MIFNLLSLFVVAAIAVLILVRWIGHIHAIVEERAWRPQELQDAEIVYAEQVFRVTRTVSISAKLGRGYRHRNGFITLVELKTRRVDRVYHSDVIELSAQRFALEAQTKESVAPHGFVLIQQVGCQKKKPHRVELLAHAAVMVLVARREAILAGEAVPQYACAEGLCDRCVFKFECQHTADPLA